MASTAASKVMRLRPASRGLLLARALIACVGLRLIAYSASFVTPSRSVIGITSLRCRLLQPLQRGRCIALAAEGEDEAINTLKPAVDEIVRGVVTAVSPERGLQVDVGAERDGSVGARNVEKSGREFNPGDFIDVKVVEHEERKLRLIIWSKEMEDLEEYLRVQDNIWLDGKVLANLNGGSSIVEVTFPYGTTQKAKGLLLKSEQSETLKEDQNVKVHVMDIDVKARKMTLSMLEPPEKQDLSGFADAKIMVDEFDAVVTEFTNDGAKVRVTPPNGPAVNGLVPTSLICKQYIEDAAEYLELNQAVKVRINRRNERTGAETLVFSIRTDVKSKQKSKKPRSEDTNQ